MNYLKFSENKWKFFNPPLNFQNRMLQSDYIKIFEEVGFKYELTYKKSTHNIKIDKCFANYSKKDLEITHSDFILYK